jgi:nucleotidyltransferase/DNA polymerase involved in DNA repair
MNVGPAIEGYLVDLGIHSIDQLTKLNADDLYRRFQRQIGMACDPCLHDTFSAIIHEARTGEKRPWFTFTQARKRREARGQLDLRISNRARP